jgi:hypothetical protein
MANICSRRCVFSHRVNNFSKDVKDGENYTVLLNQLKPDQCSRAPLQTKDLRTRAEQVCTSFPTAPSLFPVILSPPYL